MTYSQSSVITLLTEVRLPSRKKALGGLEAQPRQAANNEIDEKPPTSPDISSFDLSNLYRKRREQILLLLVPGAIVEATEGPSCLGRQWTIPPRWDGCECPTTKPSLPLSADDDTISDASASSEPSGRGTFGILKSCVITLGLCVYTALHVNLPRSDATTFSKYLTKAKWVLLGVFAPEVVVFVAWSQSEHAKHLSTELNRIFADRVRGPPAVGSSCEALLTPFLGSERPE
jgi:hypothetical protein